MNTPKNLHYVFLVEAIDSQVVGNFENLLLDAPHYLYQKMPVCIRSIEINVFPANNSLSEAIGLVIRQNEEGANQEKAQEFIKKLKMATDSRATNRFNLEALKKIIPIVSDSTVEYKIFVLSLLENSVGQDLALAYDNNSNSFKFVRYEDNGAKICLSNGVTAAQTQLENDSSWIFKNLLEPAGKMLFKKCTIKLGALPTISKEGMRGCSDIDINLFWDSLVKKMNQKFIISQSFNFDKDVVLDIFSEKDK